MYNYITVRYRPIIIIALLATACQEQNSSRHDSVINLTASQGTTTVAGPGKDVRALLQDKKGNYWFATNGDGLYRYDSHTLTHFTEKDGLCNNNVWAIQEDATGNLWLNTGSGLCRFDGRSFFNATATLTNALPGKAPYQKEGLFFNREGEMYHFDGKAFTRFSISPASYTTDPHNLNRPYGAYCTLVDRAGNLWFGTDQKGVCRYDGKSFTYFTEKGLDRGAVRSIFQDKKGYLWFGNNVFGLFRYDGKTITNFTEEKGLGNLDFQQKKRASDKMGTLARVWTITEDARDNLWIGTIDAGVWRYDGKHLTNYTTKDGLGSNAINTIYKDKKGSLWFLTDKEGVYQFNGNTFSRFTVNTQ